MKLNKITEKLFSQFNQLKTKQLNIESVSDDLFKPSLNVITKQLHHNLKPSISDEPEVRMKKEYIKDFWNSFVLLTRANESNTEFKKSGHLPQDDTYIDHMILNDAEKTQMRNREKKLKQSLNVLQHPEPPASELKDVLQGLNVNFKDLKL